MTETSDHGAATTFDPLRPRLLRIAYRMLGTVMDAEDILQEAFLRWQRAPVEEVENPRAYLSAVVTRLCIDQLRSARVKREEYLTPWLPEPLLTETPMDTTLLAESLSTAFLLLLERLSPVERAVFLLREVFDYDYDEIAQIVGKSKANCRQLNSRAKHFIAERRPRFDTDPAQEQRLLAQFAQTVATGDMDGLLEILAEDMVLYSDGGGIVNSARYPIFGARKAARLYIHARRLVPPGVEFRFARINGLPGGIGFYADGRAYSVMVFHIEGGRIRNIYQVLNPNKLKGVTKLNLSGKTIGD